MQILISLKIKKKNIFFIKNVKKKIIKKILTLFFLETVMHICMQKTIFPRLPELYFHRNQCDHGLLKALFYRF
mgnify:CR=1 FL=1